MNKPLGTKAYGSIPHLLNSKLGIGDHHCSLGHARIATIKTRDKHDVVYVQEKLDGSNVSVAKIRGELFALTRAGYTTISSPYIQHHEFAKWTLLNFDRFDKLLNDGERVIGEWLYQAHGTRYELKHEPFVPFDIMIGQQRTIMPIFANRVKEFGFTIPKVIHIGPALSTDKAMEYLGEFGFHGAIDPIEGLIYRVERLGKVDFLCKYVRPDKNNGIYLPEISNKPAIFNL